MKPGTHCSGAFQSTTHQSWNNMKRRCSDPKNNRWKYYGERGITVCERWQTFANFLQDMGEKPEGLTLDRINNDGNYEPGNCQWSTTEQQSLNRSDNRRLLFCGFNLTFSQWETKLGINANTIRARLKRGFTVKQILYPFRYKAQWQMLAGWTVLPCYRASKILRARAPS